MNCYELYGCGRVEETQRQFLDEILKIKQAHQSLLTPDRLWTLWSMARYTLPLAGDTAECGTYMGGASRLIYIATGGKSHHIFDTFEGIPQQHIIEGNRCRGGEFAVSEDRVRGTMQGCDRVSFYKGLVPDTLSAVKDKQFSLVHLDMDVKVPTSEALKFFWPRLVEGGVVVIDDYGCIAPVTQAVKEFAEAQILEIVDTAMMQCLLHKE
jgi:O-methyltransferase